MADQPLGFRARVRPQRKGPYYESNSFQGWLAGFIAIVLDLSPFSLPNETRILR